MVFFKHQHDTSNPEGNLLPQHHFDEASFNPINIIPPEAFQENESSQRNLQKLIPPTTLDPAAIYTLHLRSPCRMLDP